MSAGHDLPARDARVCWHPYTQHQVEPEPLPVVRAEGAWLELADGRRVLDAISSWWTCLHGHSEPRLVDAMTAQARSLDHVIFAGCTHEPAVEIAERVTACAPDGLERAFFSDDGSTAVEVGLKAAYQYWVRRGEPSRTVFVALEGGYHGDTFGAMSVGDPNPFFAEFGPLLFHVVHVPAEADALAQALSKLEGRVAAFICEPIVQGAAGMKAVPPEFLRAAASLCRDAGALWIADEVMTGFGRTGSLFACEQAGVAPDIMCLAKGLTGGMLPLAMTLTSERIYEAFLSDDRSKTFFHGHSFTAHPIGCAVALASLYLVQERNVPARFNQIGAKIEAGLTGSLGEEWSLRRFGGIVAAEHSNADSGYLSALGPRLREACRGGDVLLRPLGNVLYAMPPACTTDEECAQIAAAMSAACDTAVATAAR